MGDVELGNVKVPMDKKGSKKGGGGSGGGRKGDANENDDEKYYGKVRLADSEVLHDDKDTIFVCKGGTIDDEKNIIKRIDGKVIVPKYFYMAILRKTQFGYAAMAFWSNQTNEYRTNETLLSHAISIDELEKLTSIDFFCNLPDDIEEKVEKTFNRDSWGL